MIERMYAEYAWEQTATLLAIDSPSGYTAKAAEWVKDAFEKLGFDAKITEKGGVLVDLGGEDTQDALLLEAHADTLGGMVCQIKGNGRLKLTALGGMNANNAEAENVWVYTRNGKVIDGTLQLCNASVHVNGDYSSAKRDWSAMEVVLDEDISSADNARKLGILNATHNNTRGFITRTLERELVRSANGISRTNVTKLNEVLNDKEKLNDILKSPMAKALMKQFLKGGKNG